MKRQLDLTNQRFGKLTAIKEVSRERQGVMWLCKCDCGNEDYCTTKSYLINGKVISCGCSQRAPRLVGDEASFRCWYRKYKQDARVRGFCFELDVREFRSLTSQACFYCNSEPNNVFVRPRSPTSKRDCGAYICAGIDRVDTSRGYVFGNCVPCCTTCNRMKMALTQDEFLSHVQRIADNTGRKRWLQQKH